MTVYSEIYKIIQEDEYSRMIEDNSDSILEYIHSHMPNELSESEYDYIFSDDIFSELIEFTLIEMGLGANAPGKTPSPFAKKTAPKLSTSVRNAYRKNSDGENVTFLKNPTVMHKASGKATPAMLAAKRNTAHTISPVSDPDHKYVNRTDKETGDVVSHEVDEFGRKVKGVDPVTFHSGMIQRHK